MISEKIEADEVARVVKTMANLPGTLTLSILPEGWRGGVSGILGGEAQWLAQLFPARNHI